MGYSLANKIVNAFELKKNSAISSDAANARKIGQLIQLATDGKVQAATTVTALYFPLEENADVDTYQQAGRSVDVVVSGVANVAVEVATGIDAGEVVNVGPAGLGVVTGVGVTAAAVRVGIALESAAGKASIAVLLQPALVAEIV